MRPRLFLLAPQVVFRAQVNMPSGIEYPLDTLTYDNLTLGGAADVEAGMTLLLGRTAGADDLGRQRIRKPNATSTIFVGRSSWGTRDGELDVQDNAYITVLNLRQVWAKIAYFDEFGNEYKDSDLLAYDYINFVPPKANAGVGFAGTINPATGLVTVQFDAHDSWAWTLSSSTYISSPDSYFWGIEDGTITVGSASSQAITVGFPAGFRYVSLTVFGNTDDGDRSHTMYVPVYARDPDNDTSIGGFQITNWNETEYGTEIDALVLDDIPRGNPLGAYPDGTLAMLWDDENPPDTSPDRDHMLFIGWVQTEDTGIAPQRTGTLRDTTLHLVDVAGRLKRLPAWPQVMEYEPIITGPFWYYTKFPVVLYYLWYLLRWHSTALELADLRLGTQVLNQFEFETLASDAGNLFDQANSLANNVTPDHHLTCHRFGALLLVVDPLLQYVDPDGSATDRTNIIYLNFHDAEWFNLRFSYERSPRLFQLRSYGVSGGIGDTIPLGCLAPGDAPGQGVAYLETSERITFSQFDLNYTEGNRYARMNARLGPITLETLPQELVAGFSPAYMGWVQIFVGENPLNIPQRGNDLNTIRTICHQVQWRFDYQRTGLVVTVTLTLEAETSGPPAITLILEPEET